MGKLDLRKELDDYNKKQLIGLISELYENNRSVKEYLDHFISLNDEPYLKEYKAKIKRSFFSENGSYNLVAGKKAIGEFKKIGVSNSSLIELMLYYSECALQFTINFGDVNEEFYNSLEKTYAEALSLINKESLHEQFREKAQKIVINCVNIGWGVKEALNYYFFEVFNEEEN